MSYTEGLFGDPDSEDKIEKTLGGFDITEAKGLITIAKEENIEVKEGSKDNYTTTDEWEIIITFKNLAYDQNLNTGKSLTGEVLIQKEEYVPTLAELCTGEKVSECFTKNYKNDKAIVYHNATAALEDGIENSDKVAEDDSYRYVGANPNNYVCFGSACSNVGTDPNYKNLYRIIGLFKNKENQYEMKIIKADAATAEDLGNKENVDGGAYYGNYTYSKTDYKGKLTTFASYYWNSTDSAHLTYNDSTNTNMWKDSNLNTKNLNEKYYNSLEETYKAMVVEHEWQVGGTSNTGDAKSVYDYELGDNKLISTSKNCYTQDGSVIDYNTEARECSEPNDLTYSGDKAHVGLMYISDYMYATLPEYWTTTASNYTNTDVKTNNWMYIGLYEWTISRTSTIGYGARRVGRTGDAYGDSGVYGYCGVRPVLYLSSNVKITGGTGTETDPFQLEV